MIRRTTPAAPPGASPDDPRATTEVPIAPEPNPSIASRFRARDLRARVPGDGTRWTVALVMAIVACAAVMLLHAAWADSMTIDEQFITHSAACLVNTRLIDLEPTDPAGAKLLASVGVGLSGVQTDGTCPSGTYEDATYHGLFSAPPSIGQLRWLTFCARIVPILITLALILICAWWAFQFGGPVAAVLAAALIGFDPTLQAMGHLVSVDVALTFGFVAMLAALWKWRTCGRARWLVLAGLGLGFALLSKASGVILLPVALILILATAPGGVRARLRASWRPSALLIVVAYLELTVAYAPFRFSEPTAAWLPTGLNWLVPESWLWGAYHQLIGHVGSSSAQLSYLNGVAQGGGTWYYFPEALLLKSTIAGLIVLVIGLGWLAVRRHAALLWCVLPGGVYFLAAMRAGIDIGIRYVTPAIVLFLLAGSVGIALLPRGRIALAGALGAAAIIATILGPVGSIGYFNAFAAGRHSYYLADSNIDWGQDGYRLRAWWEQAGKPPIQVDLFGGLPASYFVPTAIDLGSHPERGDYTGAAPVPGTTTVVSVNMGTLWSDWADVVAHPMCTLGTGLVVVGRTCSGT